MTRVPIYTLKNPEKQTDLMPTASLMEDIRPFLPIIMGASGGLVLMGLLIILVVRVRGKSNERRGRDINTVNSSCANRTPPSDHHLHTGNYFARPFFFFDLLLSFFWGTPINFLRRLHSKVNLTHFTSYLIFSSLLPPPSSPSPADSDASIEKNPDIIPQGECQHWVQGSH